MPKQAKNKRVTMTDIAKKAGVSQTTVSFVLNNVDAANISDSTKKSVLEAAALLGYVPNVPRYFANLPQFSSTNSIGFITDEIGISSYGGEALKGAQEAAWAHQKMLFVLNTEGIQEVEETAIRAMIERKVDGIILATMIRRELTPSVEIGTIPCVTMNGYCKDKSITAFTTDEIYGGKIATQLLIDAGHRRIGFINGEMWMDAARERLVGYKKALAEAGIPYDPGIVRDGNWRPDSGYQHTKELLSTPNPPTALFCGNDLIALGAYEAANGMGLQIPADLSIVGYDDQEIASYLHPPLTTVRLPYYEMGYQSVLHLIKTINNPQNEKPFQKKMLSTIVPRNSVSTIHLA